MMMHGLANFKFKKSKIFLQDNKAACPRIILNNDTQF